MGLLRGLGLELSNSLALETHDVLLHLNGGGKELNA